MTDSAGPGPIDLCSLDPLRALKRSEAAVFEERMTVTRLEAGELLPLDRSLSIVKAGSLSLALAGVHVLELGPGDILGERGLFVHEPVPMRARALDSCECWTIGYGDVKHCFRYSRTGTVKWLGIFARSLAAKLRVSLGLLSELTMSAEVLPERLGELDLERLETFGERRTYAAGESVFVEGDASGDLHVIESGDVRIARDTQSGALVLAQLGPGDSFGELSFVDRRPRSAHAVAESDLVVYVVPAGALDRLGEQSLGTGLYLTDIICKILAHRLHVTLERAEPA